MNKYGIRIKGTDTVLRFKSENGVYSLTTEKQYPLYLIDNARIVQDAATNNNQGQSFYQPKKENLGPLEVVKVETEVVVTSAIPFNLTALKAA